MSARSQDVDLEALARPASDAAVPTPRRRWIWWLVPALLLGGLAFVFLDTARSYFSPVTDVTVVRPRTVTDAGPGKGSVVFQAAGWIEPDPYPVRVTALAEGVVSKMLVLEADTVAAGDPVCELVRDDATIAVAAAEATLTRVRAEATLRRIELANAQQSFDEAIDATEARDSAAADVRGKEAAQLQRKAAAQEAEAAVHIAKHDLATQTFLRKEKAVGPWQVELAQARLDEAQAHHAALTAEVARAIADTDGAKARSSKAKRDFELRLKERLARDTAAAAVPKADAAVAEAQAALDDAKLTASRMTVTAPSAGVVLTRDAQPGSVVGPGGQQPAVCHLYDPAELRVRVDVPQSQVAGTSAGQRAEILCDVRRGRPYEGRVLRIVDTADIQKVTLEVQVRVVDPDGLLKPDMLCQVAVYRDADTDPSATRGAAVIIPSRCLATPDSVWVVDGVSGHATRRRVKTGRRSGNDVVVLEGLNVTDKVIDGGMSGITEGSRVRIEDRP
ncbi:MAG: efflux RND transporter periplasmic adaptor subunit [Planctomycetota bacterium]|nr:efflux RND transporter periplasmic adaptor subunit [Planctomycetota bacterium]